jgi:nitroreductase
MLKPAAADYAIHELFVERWSPRAFDTRPVEDEKLLTLFEAARWSASTFNRQGWRFIVARQTYHIPYDYEPLTAVAIGYYGSIDQLIDRDQAKEQAPRPRKPLHELLFSGTWGQPAAFIPQAE